MNLRATYSLVGGAWGAVIGAPVAILVTGFMLGAAWLFLFGDDPWPVQSWLVLIPGPILGVAIFVGATALGYRYGSRAEASLEEHRDTEHQDTGREPPTEAALRRRALWLIGLAVLVGLLEVAAVYSTERGQERDREAAAALNESFERLVEARHAITGIEVVTAQGAEAGTRVPARAAISLAGKRSGGYRITWELTETLHDTPLLVGENRLTLVSGDTVVFVPLDLDMLRERYRREVLGGRGGVLVESEWPFRARIGPLLSRSEAETVPRTELQNLRLGESALLSEGEVPVAVNFRID